MHPSLGVSQAPPRHPQAPPTQDPRKQLGFHSQVTSLGDDPAAIWMSAGAFLLWAAGQTLFCAGQAPRQPGSLGAPQDRRRAGGVP